ncbi:MAG: LPXTG cell wall anchor domain-containing protein [Lactobacillus sp.]|nr:LPXTG cell wall anchor domain-containing protein [Lactobacillus sp.]
MKKLLVSVLLSLMLTWVKGVKTVQAAVSDNFTKIVFNDGKSEKVESGQLVHVNVELASVQKDKLKSDVPLTITWSGSDKVQAKGINKTKDIIVKDKNDSEQKVGTYTVEADRVLIKFNDNIEKYNHLVGRLAFDLLVHKSTDDKHEITVHAGEIKKAITVDPSDKSSLLAEVTGKLNQRQDSISWGIKVNPDEKEFLGPIKILNELPEGLAFDKSTVGIEADDVFVKLGKEEVKFDQNKLLINLNNKGRSHRTFTLKYKTKILDQNATNKINKIQLEYQLKDDDKRKISVYEGGILNDFDATFVGIRNESDDEMVRRKTLEKAEKAERDRGLSLLFSRLLKLLDSEKEDQSKNNKDIEPVKILSKTAEPASTFEAAKEVNPKGLSGFDKKEQSSTNNAHTKLSEDDADLDEDDDIKDFSTKEHSSKSHAAKLPQAGESRNGILSFVGVFILLAGMIGFKKKFLK